MDVIISKKNIEFKYDYVSFIIEALENNVR